MYSSRFATGFLMMLDMLCFFLSLDFSEFVFVLTSLTKMFVLGRCSKMRQSTNLVIKS